MNVMKLVEKASQGVLSLFQHEDSGPPVEEQKKAVEPRKLLPQSSGFDKSSFSRQTFDFTPEGSRLQFPREEYRVPSATSSDDFSPNFADPSAIRSVAQGHKQQLNEPKEPNQVEVIMADCFPLKNRRHTNATAATANTSGAASQDVSTPQRSTIGRLFPRQEDLEGTTWDPNRKVDSQRSLPPGQRPHPPDQQPVPSDKGHKAVKASTFWPDTNEQPVMVQQPSERPILTPRKPSAFTGTSRTALENEARAMHHEQNRMTQEEMAQFLDKQEKELAVSNTSARRQSMAPVQARQPQHSDRSNNARVSSLPESVKSTASASSNSLPLIQDDTRATQTASPSYSAQAAGQQLALKDSELALPKAGNEQGAVNTPHRQVATNLETNRLQLWQTRAASQSFSNLPSSSSASQASSLASTRQTGTPTNTDEHEVRLVPRSAGSLNPQPGPSKENGKGVSPASVTQNAVQRMRSVAQGDVNIHSRLQQALNDDKELWMEAVHTFATKKSVEKIHGQQRDLYWKVQNLENLKNEFQGPSAGHKELEVVRHEQKELGVEIDQEKELRQILESTTAKRLEVEEMMQRSWTSLTGEANDVKDRVRDEGQERLVTWKSMQQQISQVRSQNDSQISVLARSVDSVQQAWNGQQQRMNDAWETLYEEWTNDRVKINDMKPKFAEEIDRLQTGQNRTNACVGNMASKAELQSQKKQTKELRDSLNDVARKVDGKIKIVEDSLKAMNERFASMQTQRANEMEGLKTQLEEMAKRAVEDNQKVQQQMQSSLKQLNVEIASLKAFKAKTNDNARLYQSVKAEQQECVTRIDALDTRSQNLETRFQTVEARFQSAETKQSEHQELVTDILHLETARDKSEKALRADFEALKRQLFGSNGTIETLRSEIAAVKRGQDGERIPEDAEWVDASGGDVPFERTLGSSYFPSGVVFDINAQQSGGSAGAVRYGQSGGMHLSGKRSMDGWT